MKAYFRNFIWFSRNSNFKKWFRANFSTPHRQTHTRERQWTVRSDSVKSNNRMPIICHQIINHLRRNKASSTRKLLATRSVSLRPKKNLIIDVIYFSAMNLNRDISKFVALRYIISGNWFFMERESTPEFSAITTSLPGILALARQVKCHDFTRWWPPYHDSRCHAHAPRPPNSTARIGVDTSLSRRTLAGAKAPMRARHRSRELLSIITPQRFHPSAATPRAPSSDLFAPVYLLLVSY
jgi:hypothetical protein